jgi:F-box and WD-40 domain protein CDC4
MEYKGNFGVLIIKTGKTTKIFRGHQGGVECLQVTRGICYTGSYDKSIRAFDIKTGDCLAIFEGHTDGIYCLKIYG